VVDSRVVAQEHPDPLKKIDDDVESRKRKGDEKKMQYEVFYYISIKYGKKS